MSTIERLAELAKGATQGRWKSDKELLSRAGEWVICFDAGDVGRGIVIAETRPGSGREQSNSKFIAACSPSAIAQAAAEYAAVVAERDALREALTGMVAQHGCDCGHPHCNRCAETRECKAALAQGEVGNDN
jgi:hypothetical protein